MIKCPNCGSAEFTVFSCKECGCAPLKEMLAEIAGEYGQLHEEGKCELNFEGGSTDGCTCAMAGLVDEAYQLFEEEAATLRAKVKRLERRCERFIDAYKKFGMDVPGAPSIAALDAEEPKDA